MLHSSRLAIVVLGLVGLFTLIVGSQTSGAQEVPENNDSGREAKARPSALLTQQTRETFARIRTACEHPGGLNDWTAVEWLLTTAQDHGWEGELATVTGPLLAASPASTTLLAQARAVHVVGCARRGEAEAAMTAFADVLKGIRLRQPQAVTDLAVATALAFQLQGDLDAAHAVYERLQGAFFLNTEVRDFVTHRRERLNLVGKPAPVVELTDLAGKLIDWSDARGKVLVLDFWATNCRPCLEELPRLRLFDHDRDPAKVALLGISLDEDVSDIARLRELEPLPWPLALDQKRATAAFKVVLIPCLMALDQEGRVAAVDIPPRALRSTVATLVDRAAPAK